MGAGQSNLTGILLKAGHLDTEAPRRGECHGKSGVRLPQAADLPKSGRRSRIRHFPGPSEGVRHCPQLGLRHPASGTVGQSISLA